MQSAEFWRVALDRFAEAAGEPGNRARSQDHGQQEADQFRQRCACGDLPQADQGGSGSNVLDEPKQHRDKGGRGKGEEGVFSRFLPSAFQLLLFPEQPGRRGCAAPALRTKSHREALAGATDPVVAESGKLIASTQGGEGGSQFPQTDCLRWNSFNGLECWVRCLLTVFEIRSMRICVVDTFSKRRPRAPSPSLANL